MSTFCMYRVFKRLCNEAILKRKIGIAIHTDTLVGTPRERAMVNDNVSSSIDWKRVAFIPVLVSHAEAQETDDDIACFDYDRKACYTYTITGSCLPSYSKRSFGDIQLTRQIDSARYIKHNCLWARKRKNITQRATIIDVIRERCHMAHHTATPSRCIFTTTFCPRERQSLCSRRGRRRILASTTGNQDSYYS